jgi:hypothetical protein
VRLIGEARGGGDLGQRDRRRESGDPAFLLFPSFASSRAKKQPFSTRRREEREEAGFPLSRE